MNPVVVIPSYWAADGRPRAIGTIGVYDHTTATDKPLPELETCLESLEKVRGVTRTIILLVTPPGSEQAARARVGSICRAHPNLNPLIVGTREASAIKAAVGKVLPDTGGETISLRGYGAIRNCGLVVASILGHDIVVFLDDDEIVLDEGFLIDACYGLGMRTRQNLKVLAKSGYYLDSTGSPLAGGDVRWQDKLWSKHEEFDEWMLAALASTRISRSNVGCGGCMALHAEAFTQVAFDPWITRGEDLDYVINLRAFGLDMWFDNEWCVRHVPPPTPSDAQRFLQDVYRWTYEASKVEVINGRANLRRITPESLMPYPGHWITSDVAPRIRSTALRRAIFSPERAAYLSIWQRGCAQAAEYARSHADRYLRFQSYWPQVVSTLWDVPPLAAELFATGDPLLWRRSQPGGGPA